MTKTQSKHLSILNEHLDALEKVMTRYRDNYALLAIRETRSACSRAILSDSTAEDILLMKEGKHHENA